MRKIAIFVLLVTLAATATIAQETQDEERMFVLINYVTIKQGMEQAFMATVADHLEWHKSTDDTLPITSSGTRAPTTPTTTTPHR